jgi:glyoxylase-like metal-dependent hydrolase (beta-lactamase superfamily II)
MTLDGTRTYIVGRVQPAIIDPGPSFPAHIDAVAAAVGNRVTASVLITHAHPDHDEGAPAVAARLNAEILRPGDAETIETDAGDLTALATPGHTPDHLAFMHDAEGAVFCGDLMMGGLDTALVAAPEGNLHNYLASLQRLKLLGPRIIYPAHGPAIKDPLQAIDRYLHHREQRIAQAENALKAGPRSTDDLVDIIYGGTLDDRLRYYAASAVEAYLEYLAVQGRAQRVDEEWSLL